ncbi:hypothetical protein ACE3NQ_10070 [Paenibacillus terreus]|uniref:Uncharacterized protein n=1 Tax=Paenibacillus terreus TaxID=1387834 RepID=A0ABV5B6D9_9BACL
MALTGANRGEGFGRTRRLGLGRLLHTITDPFSGLLREKIAL